MSNYHIIVTDDRYGSYTEEKKVLGEIGAELKVLNLDSESDAIEALQDADGILVNLFPMNARIIKSLERCKVISRYGVGYDNVDHQAATQAGIWVAHVPDYACEDVSDHSAALLLACIRKITHKDSRIRQGEWNLNDKQKSYRIKDKTLGFIGYGAIARTFHRKLTGFELARVLVYDPYIDRESIRDAGGIPSDLEQLLRESDYISIHAPLTKDTRYMIGAKQLAMMKNSAILINTSRGQLVNEKALVKALTEGQIAYAGLDVFENEPLPKESPLKNMDNVILSDHAGWYSEESIVELKTKAAQNIAEVLKGEKPIYPVNQI